MEFVNGELVMYNRDGEVIHVFERGDLSKTFYNFVSKKVFEKYLFELSPSENWERGVAEWNDLTPELQAFVIALHNQKDRNLEDIRLGLLATLAEYQGLKNIKEIFANAIKGVHVP